VGGVFSGGSLSSGGTGGVGVQGLGTGNQAGGQFQAGTANDVALNVTNGPGLFAQNLPTITTDPGPNALWASNIPKAWATITTNGSGGATIVDGHGIATAAPTGGFSSMSITLAHAMANTNYAAVTVAYGGGGVVTAGPAQTLSGTSFAIPMSANPNSVAMTINIFVFGRQ
jgi:hypothetical protein